MSCVGRRRWLIKMAREGSRPVLVKRVGLRAGGTILAIACLRKGMFTMFHRNLEYFIGLLAFPARDTVRGLGLAPTAPWVASPA